MKNIMKVLSNLFGQNKKINANDIAYKKDEKGITLDTELNTLEKNSIYSTNEIVIGTWIDKPLYRKVVVYTNSSIIGERSATTNINIAHGITNLDICVNKKCINSDGYELPVISSSTGTTLTACTEIIKVDSTNITMRIINDTWNPRTWYFPLEYTKTTD